MIGLSDYCMLLLVVEVAGIVGCLLSGSLFVVTNSIG